MIDRSCSSAANHKKGRGCDQQEVVLKTLAFLCSSPVHPEPEPAMNHRDGHDHVAQNPKSSHAGEQPEDQAYSAKEFCGNGQKCEYGWDVHHSGEEAHSAGESVATKPPEHLLGAMRKENYAEHQSENGCCYVVVRGPQFANPIVLSWQARLPAMSQDRWYILM